MVSLKNISFSYAKKPVLKGVNLELKKGEIACLLGPNGTGKTTLMRILLGLLRPSSGEVFYGEKKLARLSVHERASCVAYVPQALKMSFAYLVLEVVLMGRVRFFGVKGAGEKDKQIALQSLEKLGISHLQNRVFNTLSGGEQQMVFLARALAQDARFLVMDEPTASLDFSNAIKMLSLIKALKARGYGVLMTSHFPDHAFLTSSKVILLKDGLASCGPPLTKLTSKSLSELYGSEVCVKDVDVQGDILKVCIPLLR